MFSQKKMIVSLFLLTIVIGSGVIVSQVKAYNDHYINGNGYE